MRIPILAIALSLALAGCSDPPPAGDAASTGHSLGIAGSITSLETQSFSDPNPTSDADVDCPFDEVDPQDPDPVAGQRCDRPYTKMTVNFTALPDPGQMSYSLKWYSEADGATGDIGSISGHVHPGTGLYIAEDYTVDNEAECADETDNAGCKMDDQYDSVQLWLGDILVASAALSSGSTFEPDDGLLGVSFDAAYSGKTLTLTASGLNPDLPGYDGWLITTDADGTVDHAESFSVTEGENTFEAPMNVEEYSGIHIHVAGTKLNVAVGSL